MKFRQKPVVVEAIKFRGKDQSQELLMFVGHYLVNHENEFFIETLEGEMKVSPGDWIIKGIKGDFYPCKPNIFEEAYEQIKEQE